MLKGRVTRVQGQSGEKVMVRESAQHVGSAGNMQQKVRGSMLTWGVRVRER